MVAAVDAPATRILPIDAKVDVFWLPFGADDFEEVRKEIMLTKGTACVDLGDMWEICSGPFDGIRFSKWAA